MINKTQKSPRSNKTRFLLIFTATLSLFLLLGLTAIFIYQHIMNTNNIIDVISETDHNTEVLSPPLLTEMVNENNSENTPDPDAEPVDTPPPSRYAHILNDPEYMRENLIYTRDSIVPGEAKLLFAGDILFDSYYAVMATAIQRGGTVDKAFSEDLLELMNAADVMMLNNEFTYTTRGEPFPEKQFTFRANPETASWLNDMGVNLVSLANNHTFDYGEISLLDTLDTLDAHGIPRVGAGRNIDEAAAPVYFIIEDIKIGFIAATQIERLYNPDTRGATETLPGVFRCLNPDLLLEVVAETKEKCDFLVVFLHWGTENVSEPDWLQLEQAPLIAAAGADLIVGCHPHVLQGITYHDETPVAYSLGNFWFNSRTDDTGLLEAIIDQNGLKTLRFIPAIQQNCFTSLVYDNEKVRILNKMRTLSPAITIDEDGNITK